ncbi:hypothetical protein GOODEAATRI_012777 [Goodea atripinnis]|uniref:PH domain-containing protein n=1 Tax=Goodea atripinnis TaxID=208336 RepID=A0ABV0NA68_9TELE
MKEEVQLDTESVERVFPCLDQLLVFHHAFFAAMKERRQSSGQPQGHRNYLIQQIGDILLQQETEEHANLSKALAHIREVIAGVDLRVSENERHQKLQEVWNRIENRSTAKLKSGYTFRKQDMMGPGQTLRYQGDQKPPVIALQKLIVREVANEEKGMFLISASSAGPEMYEVHTSSKEERNTWMRLIRETGNITNSSDKNIGSHQEDATGPEHKFGYSCPEEPDEYASESEEEKAAEARFQKILKLQAENLKATLSSKARSLSSHSQDSDSVFPISPATLSDPASDSSDEQEKQRNLEKRKEEVATAQRLQEQLRQEKERWERECQAKESQQVEQESRLVERERKCQLAAEKLRQEREELEDQLEEYQQSLERLREGQRSVEREREHLEDQQKLLQAWKHRQQSSLSTVIPHMVIPLDVQQVRPSTLVDPPADVKHTSHSFYRNS